MTLIYITCKDEEEAVKISKHLLDKRLIACSNMYPIRSMFWWNNRGVREELVYKSPGDPPIWIHAQPD